MQTNRGQGTIEYLVIIAIVIVIALVVVGLLLNVMGQGSGIPEQSARSAWMSASPVAITDWTQSSTTLTLVLKNNSYETINILGIGFGADDFNGSDFNNIAPGSKVTMHIDGIASCTSGNRYQYSKDNNFTIQYTTGGLPNTGRVQVATADIAGTCS